MKSWKLSNNVKILSEVQDQSGITRSSEIWSIIQTILNLFLGHQ